MNLASQSVTVQEGTSCCAHLAGFSPLRIEHATYVPTSQQPGGLGSLVWPKVQLRNFPHLVPGVIGNSNASRVERQDALKVDNDGILEVHTIHTTGTHHEPTKSVRTYVRVNRCSVTQVMNLQSRTSYQCTYFLYYQV